MQIQYELKPEEVDEIKRLGAEPFKGLCFCARQDRKPSHCQQGPVPASLMPGCGFRFVIKDGEWQREGECKRCGACCALPRRQGSPYGIYDPRGKACNYLIVEEAK